MSRSAQRRRKAVPVAGNGRRPAAVAKTPGEIDAMAASGAVLHACHELLQAECVPGVTTAHLDAIAEEFIRENGGTGAFHGYQGYPATITASINEQVVHGIPGDDTLREGDIASIDCGVILDGWVSDSARTHPVGEISDEARRLLQVTEASLAAGIGSFQVGSTMGDVGASVQNVVEAGGYSVVRTLVGHGVGRQMHEEPQVPNFGTPGTGPEIFEGMVVAIEPMVNMGGPDVVTGSDGWTVTSRDRSLSAHFEHTVAATADGPRILTAPA